MTNDADATPSIPLSGGPPEETRPRFSLRQVAGMAIVLGGAIIAFVFVLPSVVGWGEVWAIARDLSWPELSVLAAATLVNILTFAPPWMAALPGLRARQALVVTQASTASTYVAPGGPAVGMALSFAVLRGWGFEPRAVALAVTLTGIWNQLALLSFPVVALGLLTLIGETNTLLSTVAFAGALVLVAAVGAFAAAMSSEAMALRIGNLTSRVFSRIKRLLRRRPTRWTGDALVRFRREAIDLLRRRWHVLTVATLAGQLSVFLVLLASLWSLDVARGSVGFVEAFAAWAIARLLGSIPLTPGGLGVVEVGLTTVLVAFGGPLGPVVAAVLLYRFLTIVPTLGLGLLGGATWRRHTPALPASED